MSIDPNAVLAHLDAAARGDWPTFRGISAFEPHAIRLVVLRERATGANFDGLTESPADVLLVRAYLAAHPGSLSPALSDTVAALSGKLEDIFLVTDAFEHVLGPAGEGEPPPLDRFAVLPSESPTYRSLARALAADDPSLFVPGPSNLDHRLWATTPDANVT